MNIAIEVSAIDTSSSHSVRGSGFYVSRLKNALEMYDDTNKYVFFKRGDEISDSIDVIHYPYFDPFFLTLPVFRNKKNVITVHDVIPLKFPKHFPVGIKGRIKWYIQKKKLKNAHAIITDSLVSKKDIVKHTGISEADVHVVYLASGEEFKRVSKSAAFLKEFQAKYNLPDKFILYVGDVTWNKNLPRLIEAVKKINLPLVLVGKALASKSFDRSNPWNRDLVRVHELTDKDNRVHRLGFVPVEDLVVLYNMAVVFVMPSLYEGFGMPVLEAMNCGTPVVTSEKGSLSEIAGHAAMYVDPENVNDIAQGILNVYKNESLQKELSEKGQIQAKKFSWKKTAEETINIYKTLIQS